MAVHELENESPLVSAFCLPHSGAGLVARWGNVLLVVAPGDEDTIMELVDHCRTVAQTLGDGRTLSRRLAGLLSSHDGELPAFAAAAPVTAGLAVFVQGAAEVAVGDGFRISGSASLAWVDRLIPWPVTSLTMRVEADAQVTPGPYNLECGIVPGAGLTLRARLTEDEAPPQEEQAAARPGKSPPSEEQSQQAAPERPDEPSQLPAPELPPPLDRWPGQAANAPRFESVSMDADTPDREESEHWAPLPLPILSKTSKPPSAELTGPIVQGVYCKNSHFNDERVLFCAVCGVNMVHLTPVRTEGVRPPLGVLILDDGTAFQLDADYILGRDPMHDDDVRSGRLRGIVLNDPNRSVSRAHARIELRQWDVVLIDNSSANGTYVATEGDATWTPLVAGAPHMLASGTRLRLGSRALAFRSYRGA